MKIKDIIIEDWSNYKVASMFIITSICDFKCCTECGEDLCQNMDCISLPTVDISNEKLYNLYSGNNLTKAIVFGGLEPMLQFDELLSFVRYMRTVRSSDDVIVIYTGYYPDEIENELAQLKEFPNIIVKFGRFIPHKNSKYDEILGVTLVSDNQFAEKIS